MAAAGEAVAGGNFDQHGVVIDLPVLKEIGLSNGVGEGVLGALFASEPDQGVRLLGGEGPGLLAQVERDAGGLRLLLDARP
jgi:hypothetical protein